MKLCAALVLLAMAWAAPSAGAAEATQRDRAGDVSGGAAIASASAPRSTSSASPRANAAGLAVDVRLRRDFERLAGSGALKAVVAGILIRRAGARSGELLTRGSDRRARQRSPRAAAVGARGPGPRRRALRPHAPFPRGGATSPR